MIDKSKELIKSIEACILNTLNGNITISKKENGKLLKFKQLLRFIKEISQKKRKKY